MTNRSSTPESSVATGNKRSSRQGNKRSYVACQRCHSLKVKCSGGVPCERCSKARKDTSCQYPLRERRVTVPESYLQRLRRPRETADRTTAEHEDYGTSTNVNIDTRRDEHSMPPRTPDASPPTYSSPPIPISASTGQPAPPSIRPSSPSHVRMFSVDADFNDQPHPSSRPLAPDPDLQQQFIGEPTCLAFSDRILQYLDPVAEIANLHPDCQYVHNASFSRQMSSVASCKFPDRIRANLLVRVAVRFVGQDYHMFLQRDFFHHMEKMYGSMHGHGRDNDTVWVCKFFVVLALGELYSTTLTAAKEARVSTVAGTGYFLTAIGLLQDLFEEPSIDQIETLLLFSFYSRALGRVKSSHMYSGMALRSSTVLGLHRRTSESCALSALEQEHRRRLWWTVYIFDRSTCSKLGLPITIQDSDVDVAMPSVIGVSPAEQTCLGSSTDHLIAHINLAQITGHIMNDIQVPPSKVSSDRFVQNVRSVLSKLRKWDSHVPARLRWDPAGGVPRPVASLQLHFNHCIILTTRPILLHVFKLKNAFAGAGVSLHGGSGNHTSPISGTIRSLADSCVAAARTSNAIIVQLFIENALATCGYFDAHHLFASTLVLIVSAISSPNASDSDAVQTAFQLLMMMRDKGNAIAGEYFTRLLQIQGSVNHLFARATATREATLVTQEVSAVAGAGVGSEERIGAGVIGGREADGNGRGSGGTDRLSGNLNPLVMPQTGMAVFDEYDWSKFVAPPIFYGNYGGDVNVDPLDNPLLQAFLDQTDGSQDEGNLVGTENTEFVI